jgi:hypothetical protein
MQGYDLPLGCVNDFNSKHSGRFSCDGEQGVFHAFTALDCQGEVVFQQKTDSEACGNIPLNGSYAIHCSAKGSQRSSSGATTNAVSVLLMALALFAAIVVLLL